MDGVTLFHGDNLEMKIRTQNADSMHFMIKS